MFKIRVSALTFGVIGGFIAVVAQVFFVFRPPNAYGICLVCHARDLTHALLTRWGAGTYFSQEVSGLATNGLILTTLGIILGAAIAALISGEWKLRFAENPLVSISCGFLVMCCALIVSGCPMRILLRGAYGDETALLAIPFMVAGIFVATMLMKGLVKRRAKSR
ncbi:MAG: hypothetical protein FWD39_03630 [Clostridiales bacterium]|nr:hypothetical protein [Clostridiales bacterium]